MTTWHVRCPRIMRARNALRGFVCRSGEAALEAWAHSYGALMEENVAFHKNCSSKRFELVVR